MNILYVGGKNTRPEFEPSFIDTERTFNQLNSKARTIEKYFDLSVQRK